MMDDAVSPIHDTVGVVDEAHLAGALSARPTISTEQARLVATLTTSGAGIDIVNAPAGTGKTFCLDAARDAWEAAGHTIYDRRRQNFDRHAAYVVVAFVAEG